MSLINDMLRDLEQRGDHKPNWDQAAAAVFADGKNRRRVVIVLCCLVLVGSVSSFFLYSKLKSEPAPETVSRVAVQPSFAEVQQREDVAEAPVVDTLPAAESSSTHTSATPVVETALELSALDLVAEPDMLVFKLHFSTIPEYRLDQNNDGNKRLVITFPTAIIGRRLTVPDFASASLLKEFSLKPGNNALQLLVDLKREGIIDAVQTRTSATEFLLTITIKQSDNEGLPSKALPKAPETSVPVTTKAAITESMPVQSVSEKTASTGAKIDKVTVKVEPGVSAYRAGLRQLTQGQMRAAKDSFYQALKERPELIDARMQLIGLLQQQHQMPEAAQVLHQGLELTPEDPVLRKLLARQLMTDKDFDQAIALLSAAPQPELARDQEYYALLAVLYHDAGQYQSALKTYQNLVQVQPANATWWFGLALCADQIRDLTIARNAYQTALQLPTLRADLQVYARQRLQQL